MSELSPCRKSSTGKAKSSCRTWSEVRRSFVREDSKSRKCPKWGAEWWRTARASSTARWSAYLRDTDKVRQLRPSGSVCLVLQLMMWGRLARNEILGAQADGTGPPTRPRRDRRSSTHIRRDACGRVPSASPRASPHLFPPPKHLQEFLGRLPFRALFVPDRAPLADQLEPRSQSMASPQREVKARMSSARETHHWLR